MILKKDVYNIAKCITVVLVVVAHATRMYTGLGVVDPVVGSLVLKQLTEIIYSFHMPLFMLLSGCVYGYCIEAGKYQQGMRFLGNKAKRLLIPYVIFGVCYVAPTMVLLRFTEQDYLTYLWEGIILSKNSRHLWYVFALFWIFLLAMLVRKLLLTTWGLPVVMLLAIGAYLISSYIPAVFQLRAATMYQVFFFAGVCINKYFDKLWLWIILFGSFIVSGDAYLSAAFIGIGIVLGISLLLAKGKVAENRIVKGINQNGYGIYFFHPMIIYVCFALTYKMNISPYVLCVGIIVIAFALSWVLTVGVRKMKMGIIIGE